MNKLNSLNIPQYCIINFPPKDDFLPTEYIYTTVTHVIMDYPCSTTPKNQKGVQFLNTE